MLRGRPNSREYFRLNVSCLVGLHTTRTPNFFKGVTKNLSPGGAFITTMHWRSFEENEQALLTFYLPADFTNQDATICLLGNAKVIRIDRDNEGIGVQFDRPINYFGED